VTPREKLRPLLLARYRTTPTDQLSEETGVPVNTLRSWAHRLGLTSKERLRDSGREWAMTQHQPRPGIARDTELQTRKRSA
jgi:DNA-directed RNA polymerase specialized sigma24 family protein